MFHVPDPLIVASVYFFILALSWYFSMDVHNASRALWNACGSIKGKIIVSSRRSSETEFQFLRDSEDTSVPSTPEGRESWILTNGTRPSSEALDGVIEFGRFTEEEFLARFGGMYRFCPGLLLGKGNSTPKSDLYRLCWSRTYLRQVYLLYLHILGEMHRLLGLQLSSHWHLPMICHAYCKSQWEPVMQQEMLIRIARQWKSCQTSLIQPRCVLATIHPN